MRSCCASSIGLIFLFTTEDRGLLHDPNASDAAKALYADGYSVARLRTRRPGVRRETRTTISMKV